MSVRAKICGLSTPQAVQAAVDGGAELIGFVFFAPSPRDIAPERAATLAAPARAKGLDVVAVTVDASDALLDAIARTLKPDLIQLHGHETPARAAEVHARTGAGVIRAFRVSEAADLEAARAFEGVADYLMFDAKAPKGAILPGGNGAAFDWSLLTGRSFAKPWFLAGGLDPDNVTEAVRASGAPLADVSSGVETAPGVKDPALIKAFLEAVHRV
ncbi:phosphoribosylanthranilate isomerase [Caulobacter sp. S45]|uniref:phosphoribosylanthranilate isomerase n=1 Tax=Caulobacter sp. S45 TaxID=1641861 RepID=UPI00131BA853|nr:phosphoribosylanthranilate isomerase [Caulobacter sp. S45]